MVFVEVVLNIELFCSKLGFWSKAMGVFWLNSFFFVLVEDCSNEKELELLVFEEVSKIFLLVDVGVEDIG